MYSGQHQCISADISSIQGDISVSRMATVYMYIYSGRTKYSACVSKFSKLSEEYRSPQKTQRAAVFFIPRILAGRMIKNLIKLKYLNILVGNPFELADKKTKYLEKICLQKV